MKQNRNKASAEALNINSYQLPVLGKSLVIGLIVGVVVSLYRMLLEFLEQSAFSLYGFVRTNPVWIVPMFIILILVALLVGRIMKAQPMCSGSGSAEVKNLIAGRSQYSWWKVLIAKVLGSGLATAGGLSLGREGPCIQLGACVAQGISDKYSHFPAEKKVLIASGAGAGMGAALNAPLAGVMFAIEEIFRYFSPLILLSTLTAAVAAQFVCRSIFGIAPVLEFAVDTAIPLADFWVLIIIGLVIGAAGSIYNFILIKMRTAYSRVRFLTTGRRPLVPFICAGILALIMPEVLCAGHAVFNVIEQPNDLSYLWLLLAVKFVFVMICLGSNTPGGDLFPLLAVGAIIGAIFGTIAITYWGFAPEFYFHFIILAMAGFFTSIVGAPITAIVLLMEMTGSFPLLLSLSVVCLISYVVTDLLSGTSVYKKARLTYERENAQSPVVATDEGEKITVELIVHFGSPAEGKLIKDLPLPPNCLVISIKRGKQTIIPKGDTQILAEDYLVFITDRFDEDNSAIYEKLIELTTQ